ncbi:MAG: alpha/beta hydrolase [Spartobacteria bacterium]|nr:alpha/beta hydrolase [Spartobacteria bacterium]
MSNVKVAFLHWSLRVLVFALVLVLATVALIYVRQHSLIYHPRPYDSSYRNALPDNGIEIISMLPIGEQTAYYIPGHEKVPTRVWVAFCGNGSLALDWTTILANYPNNGDAFLLIDYPGYGKNRGYATIQSTRAAADNGLRALIERLALQEEQVHLCVIGHSLGSAVALDFATRHRVERIVAIAPFTTLREEAATVVGHPLSRLLVENYDNRKALAQIAKRNPGVRVSIFHGVEDQVIPCEMGRELAREFASVDFFPISGADHVSVLTVAKDRIITSMTN